MRNLSVLINEHLDCKHSTTEVKRDRDAQTVTLSLRHGSERLKFAVDIIRRNNDAELGAFLFHQVANEILRGDILRDDGIHRPMKVGITDEEYESLVLTRVEFEKAAGVLSV